MAFLDGEEQSPVQAGVLNVNVVLEAFGNAKTVYNNNSSRFVRFAARREARPPRAPRPSRGQPQVVPYGRTPETAQGKFTELQFDPSGVLAGARVREYLLEKVGAERAVGAYRVGCGADVHCNSRRRVQDRRGLRRRPSRASCGRPSANATTTSSTTW